MQQPKWSTRNGMDAGRWMGAARFAGFDEVAEYRKWLSFYWRDKRRHKKGFTFALFDNSDQCPRCNEKNAALWLMQCCGVVLCGQCKESHVEAYQLKYKNGTTCRTCEAEKLIPKRL